MERSPVRFLEPVFSLQGYRMIFTSGFLKIFMSSVFLAALTSAVCLLAGYPFAYILARSNQRYRNLLLLLVIIPFWTNSLIRTYALIFIIKTNGLLNALLLKLGIISVPLSMMYTDFAVLIGLVYTLMPFMILPLYASIEKLDPRYLEAARDLGAGKLQTFFHVTLPLTLPGIIAGIMLVFLPALGMFYIPDILGGAKSMLVGNFIKNQFLTSRDWPAGASASVVLTLIMAILLLAYHLSESSSRNKAVVT
jgi:spermidine/putrescine transport system permease protein